MIYPGDTGPKSCPQLCNGLSRRAKAPAKAVLRATLFSFLSTLENAQICVEGLPRRRTQSEMSVAVCTGHILVINFMFLNVNFPRPIHLQGERVCPTKE